MHLVGLLESDEKRLPLSDLAPANRKALVKALRAYGLV
jgi:hypothetical protein